LLEKEKEEEKKLNNCETCPEYEHNCKMHLNKNLGK
jgi:hypothetical protein